MPVTKIMYPSNTIMPGPLLLEQPQEGSLEHMLTPQRAALAIQTIGQAAYAGSSWLEELADKHSVQPQALASSAFDPTNPTKLHTQTQRIRGARKSGGRTAYWLGEATNPDYTGLPGVELPPNLFASRHTGQPNGFVKVAQEDFNKGPLVSRLQRASGVGAFVCLHDICVTPSKQGSGFAKALLYTALKDQPGRLRSSLITPTANEPMLKLAEKISYKVTHEFVKNDLLDVPVPMVRLEATSVKIVRQMLVSAFPSLHKQLVLPKDFTYGD